MKKILVVNFSIFKNVGFESHPNVCLLYLRVIMSTRMTRGAYQIQIILHVFYSNFVYVCECLETIILIDFN